MIEYRLSPEDDELDDFEEGAELSLDDDMGDYGLEEDDEELAVPAFTPRPSVPAAIVVETAVIEVEEGGPATAPPARKPVKKAAAPAKKTASAKKAAPAKVAAKKAAPKKKAAAKKKAAPKKAAKKAVKKAVKKAASKKAAKQAPSKKKDKKASKKGSKKKGAKKKK
jgi:hypothetical protein